MRPAPFSANEKNALLQYIGTAIRFAIEDSAWTNLELSKRTGISAAHISNLVHAKTSPSMATLARIAAAFDCRVTDFLPLPGEVLV